MGCSIQARRNGLRHQVVIIGNEGEEVQLFITPDTEDKDIDRMYRLDAVAFLAKVAKIMNIRHIIL